MHRLIFLKFILIVLLFTYSLVMVSAAQQPDQQKHVQSASQDIIQALDANLSGPSATPESEEMDYFPNLTLILSQPASSTRDAERAVARFLEERDLGQRAEWGKLQSSKHYYYVRTTEATDLFALVYVRKGGTYVRLYAPRF